MTLTATLAPQMTETSAGNAWPEGDLEHLGACPCCESAERALMFKGLRDFAFRVAPGAWTMWRCGGCRCGYLDPRPTPASIGRAYETYYTHVAMPTQAAGWKARLKFKLLIHARQALSDETANRVLAVAPGLRAKWRRFGQGVRHTPLSEKPGARLLDIGCGDGAFLETAARLGYAPEGMDADAAAVEVACRRGFEVRRASLPGSGLPKGDFEHITMNSVLEHLHDPVAALREVHGLLKPGGRVWLTQPNLGALGLAEFGIHWRGMEPPRHLTLWETKDLAALLIRCGFERVKALPTHPRAAEFYFRHSRLQQLGLDPYRDSVPFDDATAERCAEAYRRSAEDSTLGESLTLVGFRPTN